MFLRYPITTAIFFHVIVPLLFATACLFIPEATQWNHFLPQGLGAYGLASLVRILWKDQVPNSWWLVLSLVCLAWGSVQSLILSTQTNFDLSELISCLIFATPVYFQQQNHSSKLEKSHP
jgi:hypothetical protein